MSALLDELYKEYSELFEKIQGVRYLIVKYGGKIPEEPISINLGDDEVRSLARDVAPTSIPNYPWSGTWKEKILSVLSSKNQPMTTKEISAVIFELEEFFGTGDSAQHTHNMVTQIASAMGRNGEIGVDSNSFRNKYFIKDQTA